MHGTFIFLHRESTNSDKSSTVSPIQIDAFSNTEDENTSDFRYNPRFFSIDAQRLQFYVLVSKE